MIRLLAALVLLLGFGPVAIAAPEPKSPADPTKDREGNPLPKGATARLGALVFRRANLSGLWYSADGASLYSWDRQQMIGWDARTGKPLASGGFPLGQKFIGRHPVLAGGRLISFEDVYSQDGLSRHLGYTVTATGSDGKVISQVNCSGRLLGVVADAAASSFTLSRDGTRAASVSDDGSVRAFDLTTGKEIFKETVGNAALTGVVLAPDGKVLFVQEASKGVRRFSLPDGKELAPLAVAEGRLSHLGVTADGARAVTKVSVPEKTANGGVRIVTQSFSVVHDLATGKAVGKLEVGGPHYCGPIIGSEAILVMASTYRPPAPSIQTLARWNLNTMKKEWEIVDASGETALAPDGKRLAIANTASIRIFDAATGKRLDAATAHPNPIDRVAFSDDGETVTTRCQAARMTWSLSGERKSATDSPELWDGRGDGERRDGPRAWLEIAADGKTVELVGGPFDDRKGAWRMPLGADVPERPLTHDGKRVIGAALDAKLGRWDVSVYDGPAGKRTSAWTVAVPPGPPIHPAMALSGDGKFLFGFDGDVVGRDPATGKETVRLKTGPVMIPGGTYSPFPVVTTFDGTRVAVVQQNLRAQNGTLRVFEAKTGKELATHDLGRSHFPGLLFNRTGSRVAVWHNGTDVIVYNAEGRAEPRKLDSGAARVTCAAFSPNGASLAVGYENGTTLLWDLTAK